MYGLFALWAIVATNSALASAHDFRKRLSHEDAVEANRLLKRYPPDRATFAITTTPAFAATGTVVAALGEATQGASGAFNSNVGFNPLAATPTTCAPSYTAPSMITGTGTLPKPSTFVKKRFGDRFLNLDGAPFTIVGPSTFAFPTDGSLCSTDRLYNTQISTGSARYVDPCGRHARAFPDPPNFALRTKTTVRSDLTLTRVECARHLRSQSLWVPTRYVMTLRDLRTSLRD